MKAAIISLESESSKWTIEAMKKYFNKVDSINIKEIEVRAAKNDIKIYHNEKLLEGYDCIYAKGSFRYALTLTAITTALFDKCYMPISPEAFDIVHDKFLTQLVLQKNKIPMPTAYFAPTITAAKEILRKVNYPIIIKLPKGTGGKGVMFAESFPNASSLLDAIGPLKVQVVIQEYIETNSTDTRAIVVGNKVVASYQRKATKGEKRANIHMGGVGVKCVLDEKTKKVAVKTARVLNSDICAVDILQTNLGPMVIEANLSPGLQGATNTTGINVAEEIAKFLYKKTKERKDKGKVRDASKVFEDLGIRSASDEIKEIIINLDFRGNRILLPELITKITKFDEKDDLIIRADKGILSIEKVNGGQG
ncbi:MAG: RimK family alpha-L-glutamate ligase [Candidatus Nanoarchaeia archaeon]|nr:RimK family alpha-L-glutamate ligase [Candidatus Nanoarchaeia archaeon]